jgi:hypothetical protein
MVMLMEAGRYLTTKEAASAVSDALKLDVQPERICSLVSRNLIPNEALLRVSHITLIREDKLDTIVQALKGHDRRLKARSPKSSSNRKQKTVA